MRMGNLIRWYRAAGTWFMKGLDCFVNFINRFLNFIMDFFSQSHFVSDSDFQKNIVLTALWLIVVPICYPIFFIILIIAITGCIIIFPFHLLILLITWIVDEFKESFNEVKTE